MLPATLISCVPCCFMNHEKENKNSLVYKSNNGNKIVFFLLFFVVVVVVVNIRHAIKNSSLPETQLSLNLRMNKLSYILSYIKQDIYTFLFYFPSSVLLLFFSASFLLGTQHLLTLPPAKSSTFPLKKIPVFQSASPWHTIFPLSCVIAPSDSAPAQSPSGKELNTSSQEGAHFSGICILAY